MKFDTFYHGVNSVTTALLAITTILFLPFMAIFYIRRFRQWGDETFEARYGAVFEGLRTDRKSSLGYPLLFVLRRILLALVAIVFLEYLFVQIIFLVVFQIAQLAYLLHVVPFEEPVLQRVEIFNEVMILFLSYALICFTGANAGAGDNPRFYDAFFISGVAVTLGVHIGLLIKASYLENKDKIAKKCCRQAAEVEGRRPLGLPRQLKHEERA